MERKKAIGFTKMAGKTDLTAIIKDLQNFKKEIQQSGWSDAKCILFGSWAKGKQTESSDIDVCVVSKNIKDRYGDKMKMASISNKYNILIEPVAMLPQDFKDKYYTLAYEVKKCGIEIP